LNLLKTKYFSERASADKVDASFGSAGGGGGFTGTLAMNEFFYYTVLSLLKFFLYFKIEVINIMYGIA
jgi:hypothetical protein